MSVVKKFCPNCGSLCFYGPQSCLTCMYEPKRSAQDRPMPESPLVVSYGMGVDSTAALTELVRLGIRPDLILMADTGGEKPETYAYQPVIDAYLKANGFPQVVVVKAAPKRFKWAPYKTLEEKCLVNQTLPSIAYGHGTCAAVFKIKPQNDFCNKWEPALRAWRTGRKVVKLIGYDAGTADSRRAYKIEGKGDDDQYHYWYPLREWGWDRERCRDAILAAGLPVPPKSACFFCPSSKKAEIEWLRDTHPELYEHSLKMEEVARNGRHGLKTVKGLGRNFSWAECACSQAT